MVKAAHAVPLPQLHTLNDARIQDAHADADIEQRFAQPSDGNGFSIQGELDSRQRAGRRGGWHRRV